MDEKRKRLLELARERRNRAASPEVVSDVSDHLEERWKRPSQGIWRWPTRLYIPCPLRVKIEFTRIARANYMSQAELGLVIVCEALGNEEATQAVLNAYREGGKEYDQFGQKR